MTRIRHFFTRATRYVRNSLRRVPWTALATSLLADLAISAASSLVLAAF